LLRYGLVLSNIGSFSNPSTVVELAQQAEAAGWESLFLWDHLAWVWSPKAELGGADRLSGRRPLDPWTMLGAVAVKTERLLLGTCVTPVPRRRPQVLALQVATLDELSGGRAALGAGIGGNRREFEEFGESFDSDRRWELLEGGLELIRELWAGPLGPRKIPIWIGGNSTRARLLAARYDGWMPDSTTPEEMRMSPEDIRDETQQAIAVMGYSTPGERALHDAYAGAGTTWWLESLHDRRGSLDELLARVAAGP
jgi:alkanesulfonate monooxygenase SsuD/methylene tetrahydromethanopterin reductase-like flavin-dependent oxidoreductase (luciferase family)